MNVCWLERISKPIRIGDLFYTSRFSYIFILKNINTLTVRLLNPIPKFLLSSKTLKWNWFAYLQSMSLLDICNFRKSGSFFLNYLRYFHVLWWKMLLIAALLTLNILLISTPLITPSNVFICRTSFSDSLDGWKFRPCGLSITFATFSFKISFFILVSFYD